MAAAAAGVRCPASPGADADQVKFADVHGFLNIIARDSCSRTGSRRNGIAVSVSGLRGDAQQLLNGFNSAGQVSCQFHIVQLPGVKVIVKSFLNHVQTVDQGGASCEVSAMLTSISATLLCSSSLMA